MPQAATESVKHLPKPTSRSIFRNAARWVVLVMCVTICLGGAVNEGFSAWVLATPFAYVIWRIAKTKDAVANSNKLGNVGYRITAVLFFAVVISVSTTQYRNPWIYPILVGGYVTTVADTRFIQYGSEKTVLVNGKMDYKGSKEIAKLAPGTRLQVVRIYGDSGDLYQRVGLVVTDVSVEAIASETAWKKRNAEAPIDSIVFQQIIQPSKTVQAPWAETLGKLMLWPITPILLADLPQWFKKS